MARNKVASAMLWASIDKITTKGLAAVVSIILARLIDPEHYGIIAIASIFIIVLDIFVDPGMTSALIQKKDSDDLDFSTILLFNLGAGTLLYGLLFSFAPLISSLYNQESLTVVLRVMSVKILIAGINSVQLAYVQKHMMFKKYCFISFFGTFLGAGIAILMAYKGFGVWALVANYLIDGFFDVILTVLIIRWIPKLRFSYGRFKAMFSFAGKMLATKFIDMVYVELSEFAIGLKYSSADLAFYDKGKKFPQMVVSNANTALGNVLFPAFSNIQDDLIALKKSLRTVAQMSSFVMFPLLIGLAACADNFVTVLLTDKWNFCIPYVRIMCIYFMWLPFSNVILQGFKAIGRSGTVFTLECIKKTYGIALIVLAIVFSSSALTVAISFMISSAISLFLDCYTANKYLDYKNSEVIKDVAPSLVIALLMGVIVWAIGLIPLHSILILLIQFVVGICVYFLLAHIFKFNQLTTLLKMIKRK